MTAPLLEIRNLSVRFPRGRDSFLAVDDVSFDLAPSETLGLVGESGSGKTTIGRAVLRLLAPGHRGIVGGMRFRDAALSDLRGGALKRFRAEAQMVFQDPVSSFNPRRTIERIVAEGLEIQGLPAAETRDRVDAALAEVGLSRAMVKGRRPHQFSGGQCQRIAIARALALRPSMLVCDEPVASLDVSVQARVLNLLRRMRQARSLGMIFISHDLAVVRSICDRVAVMYMGRIVEIGPSAAIFAAPAHPYTRTLLDAVPVPDASRKLVPDRARAARASRLEDGGGCAFRGRCARATGLCTTQRPPLAPVPGGHMAACHHPLGAAASAPAPASA
ncbi:oligopeptide/dipeptide ABC transporter ATP-binding protein [Mangrovicoccus algicola]|uniref:ABC transporter ATP-binding protein n=1 Tax=Mangrovicoccus algicola TaxID=2771008 RepID=A0A8J7CUB5_9RHOB|nr:ABC transporter ATP-binding protein [Mangrovicoccus algicola]MBE3637259.1 ABC transporter ATP-binding protein [Mangrovicoccus algicola]